MTNFRKFVIWRARCSLLSLALCSCALTHLRRFCKCLFWLLAAFSDSNFGKVYIIEFFKVSSLIENSEQNECRKIKSDYLYFSLPLSSINLFPNFHVLYTIGLWLYASLYTIALLQNSSMNGSTQGNISVSM